MVGKVACHKKPENGEFRIFFPCFNVFFLNFIIFYNFPYVIDDFYCVLVFVVLCGTNSWELLGTPGDSWGFLGIPGNYFPIELSDLGLLRAKTNWF